MQIELSFAPNHSIDIAVTLEKKQAALDAYAGELRGFLHPRSQSGVRVFAELRGASWAGTDRAGALLARIRFKNTRFEWPIMKV